VHLLVKNNFDVIKMDGTMITIIDDQNESFCKRHRTAPAMIFFDRDVTQIFRFFDEVLG